MKYLLYEHEHKTQWPVRVLIRRARGYIIKKTITVRLLITAVWSSLHLTIYLFCTRLCMLKFPYSMKYVKVLYNSDKNA